jgi:hypothetical protein
MTLRGPPKIIHVKDQNPVCDSESYYMYESVFKQISCVRAFYAHSPCLLCIFQGVARPAGEWGDRGVGPERPTPVCGTTYNQGGHRQRSRVHPTSTGSMQHRVQTSDGKNADIITTLVEIRQALGRLPTNKNTCGNQTSAGKNADNIRMLVDIHSHP